MFSNEGLSLMLGDAKIDNRIEPCELACARQASTQLQGLFIVLEDVHLDFSIAVLGEYETQKALLMIQSVSWTCDSGVQR